MKIYIIFVQIPSVYSYSGNLNEVDCVFLSKEKATNYIELKNNKQNKSEGVNYFFEEYKANE